MMYRGKHEARRSGKTARKGRLTAMIVSVVLILALAIGGTIAWMSTKTDSVVNTFNPSRVTCEVKEGFDGKVKTDVNVQNTGDIPAFIRVKLVVYRTNDVGQHIGGVSEVPAFTLGKDWAKCGDYYYYTYPVAPGATPAANLAEAIELVKDYADKDYADADGGHQSIDVIAEAIQAGPEAAVQAAWGNNFSIKNGELFVTSGN